MNNETCCEVERERQINAQLDRLVNEIDVTETRVDELSSRLNPILSEPSPPEDSNQKDGESLAPIASMIRTAKEKISYINERLSDLNSRAEV